MTDLPDPWQLYAGLQEELNNLTTVNDRSWGLEGGLYELVQKNGIDALTEGDAERACATAARRERSRARARRNWLVPLAEDRSDPLARLEARSALRAIATRTSVTERALLHQVAVGAGYAEIANQTGRSVGSTRVLVMRLRSRLRSVLAEARSP